MGQDFMLVVQPHAKHGARQNGRNGPFKFDWLFGAHAPFTKNQLLPVAQVKTSREQCPGGNLEAGCQRGVSREAFGDTEVSSLGLFHFSVSCVVLSARVFRRFSLPGSATVTLLLQSPS
jgi:hypothetical protein